MTNQLERGKYYEIVRNKLWIQYKKLCSLYKYKILQNINFLVTLYENFKALGPLQPKCNSVNVPKVFVYFCLVASENK